MRTLIPSLVAFIVYLAMACWRTWPLVTSLESISRRILAAPYLLTWILAWDTRTLFHQPMRLFDGNIFYPHENVLAFSDHLLGALPVFVPFYLISGSAVTAYNLMFIVSFALSGWAAFALADTGPGRSGRPWPQARCSASRCTGSPRSLTPSF